MYREFMSVETYACRESVHGCHNSYPNVKLVPESGRRPPAKGPPTNCP